MGGAPSGLLRLAAGLAALAIGAFPAGADPRLCRQLADELATLPMPDQLEAEKWDDAIVVQRQELGKVEARARGAGCGPAARSERCMALRETMLSMQENLDELLVQQQALRAGAASSRHRDHLLATLDANGCDPAAAEAWPESGAPDSGPWPPEEDPSMDAADLEPAEGSVGRIVIVPGLADMDGLYRTACVRLCDGYYFPLSPASTPADFPRDRDSCSAQCPGTEVEMYYQPTGVDEPSTMLSTGTGQPYSQLPAAFLYRKPGVTRPPACGCTGPQTTAGGLGAGATTLETPKAPSSSDGSAITYGAAPDATAPPVSVLPPPGKRKVRVVGPTFLPDPSAAKGPPVQDRKGAP